MKKYFMALVSLFFVLTSLSLSSQAADWQRTVIFIYGQTELGQDMFLRGGIDHHFAQNHLGTTCTLTNMLCTIPMRHRNTLNPYTAGWKKGDSALDWYGLEANQYTSNSSGLAQGSALEWTTNNPTYLRKTETDGFGFTPLNTAGDHYWMLDVDMDCSKTYQGWFELKSYIANGPGWEGDIAQTGVPYPSKNHFARCGKINTFQRNSNTAMVQDFVNATAIANKIFLQVDRIDGYFFVFVNGIERMRFDQSQARVGEKIDITALMWQGANDIRLVASTESGSGGYGVKVWADTQLIADEHSEHNIWQGISFEKTLSLTVANAKPRRTLSIIPASSSESAIYINNVFTGKFAPAEFELAPGEYRLGIGESKTELDLVLHGANIQGQFREKDIVIGDQNLTIQAAAIPLLTRVHEHKVAIVPFTNLHCGLTDEAVINSGFTISAPSTDIGVMTAEDMIVAEKVVNLTSEKWLQPMSYGLTKWKVTMLEPVTQKVYKTDHLRLEDDIQFSDDLSKYDMVIYIMPDRTQHLDAHGNRIGVVSGFGGTGGRPATYMPASWLDAPGKTLNERLASAIASSGMGHEALHVYAGYTQNDYSGVANLHGADVHGYEAHDRGFAPDWVIWQQDYIRSQIKEDQTVRMYIFKDKKPATSSLYVGLFNVMHSGFGAEQLWSYSKPASRVQNTFASQCLTMTNKPSAESVMVGGDVCGTSDGQRWSLKHVQNGAYSLFNESSQQCAELSDGELIQKRCNHALQQRFVLEGHANETFSIKSLSGQCLVLSPADIVLSEICSPTQSRQLWRFN